MASLAYMFFIASYYKYAKLGVLPILWCYEKPISIVAIAMIISGITVSLIWKLGLKLLDAVYKVFPGMAAGFLVYLVAYLFMPKKKV